MKPARMTVPHFGQIFSFGFLCKLATCVEAPQLGQKLEPSSSSWPHFWQNGMLFPSSPFLVDMQGISSIDSSCDLSLFQIGLHHSVKRAVEDS
jgi:hypothetical protein